MACYRRIFFLSWMGLCLNVIAEQPELTFITVDEPPLNYIDETGSATGFSIDLVRLIQKKLNRVKKIEFFPEGRAIKYAELHENTVIFSLSRTPERENKFYWLQQVAQKDWVLYARADVKNIDLSFSKQVICKE